MSQEVRLNGWDQYNLLVNGIYLGYNRLTNPVLTLTLDIQILSSNNPLSTPPVPGRTAVQTFLPDPVQSWFIQMKQKKHQKK